MSLIITDECINCDVCEPECPNQAIFFGAEHYQIRPGRCTECVGFYDSQQCQKLCPIEGCIIVDAQRAETLEELQRKAVRLRIGAGLDQLIRNQDKSESQN